MAGQACILFAVAIVVRVVVTLASHPESEPISDEWSYYEPACQLANGAGYVRPIQQWGSLGALPSAYRVPGTSVLVALAMSLFGVNATSARLFAAVVSALSAPLAATLARLGGARLAGAWGAGIAAAVYPSGVFYSGKILSEPFFVPLLLLGLIVSNESIVRRSGRWLGGASLLWGFLTLFKPTALPMAAMYLLYAWYSGIESRRALVCAALLFALPLAPWAIRNQVQFGRPFVLGTEGGETFLGANNPYVLEDPKLHGMWIAPVTVPEYASALGTIRDEGERSRAQTEIAMTFLRSDPGAVIPLIFFKLARAFTPVTESGGFIRIAVLLSYGGLLLALAAGALCRTITRTVALDLALIWVFVMVVVTAVYWGNLSRGRLPVEYAMIPWGAISAEHLVRRWFARPADGA